MEQYKLFQKIKGNELLFDSFASQMQYLLQSFQNHFFKAFRKLSVFQEWQFNLGYIIKIININMNRLAFDPNKEIVYQWKHVYLSKEQVTRFESLIDKLYLYLDVVLTHKIKFLQKERKKKELISATKNVILQGIDISNKVTDIGNQDDFFSQRQKKDVAQQIRLIVQLKRTFMSQYDLIFTENTKLKKKDTRKEDFVLNLVAKYKNPQHYKKISNSKINFNQFFLIFQKYLSNLENDILRAYMQYFSEGDDLIQKFVSFKIHSLRIKISQFVELKNSIFSQERVSDVSQLIAQSYYQIKTLFQNLFIEAHYLDKLVKYNLQKLKKIEEKTDKNNVLLQSIRQKHKLRMKILDKNVDQLKEQVRNVYISLYETTRVQRNDPLRLWRNITDQIAVNQHEFTQTSNTISFTNGLFFAMLLLSLVGILVFRGLTLSALESNSRYLTEFKIWRGASYLIFTNWILGIMFYLLDYFHVNYRLILIEVDTFVPKPQPFLFTATILSAIYLIMFLAYLLKAENIIQGYDLMQHLSYFVWLINIIFMINPFKILNYQGRRFFVKLIGKALISPFRPMNNTIFIVTLIMGSFVQPFSDFSFTACSLVYDMQRDCVKQARVGTFIYAQMYLLIRFAQCIRMDSSFRLRVAVLLSINNVVSSFIYNLYLYKGLFIYWVISAILASLAGAYTVIKEYQGLISLNINNLTTNSFSRQTYLATMITLIILSVGWVFTVSNNLSFSDSISPIYFLVILSYTDLTRKGLYIFFVLEDYHSTNVNNLNATISDGNIYAQLKKRYSLQQVKVKNTKNDISQEIMRESGAAINSIQQLAPSTKDKESTINVSILEQLKENVSKQKIFRLMMQKLQNQFCDYLTLMNTMYKRLEWQKQI